jgi:gliding motility-associated-like protein
LPEIVLTMDDCGGTLNVIWQDEIACNHVLSHIQTVTIQDTQEPLFVPINNLDIDCSDPDRDGEIANWLNQVIATDNCDMVLTIEHNYDPLNLPETGCGVLDVTFIATDACGNTSVIIGTITVVDLVSPDIHCPEDLIIECEDGIDALVEIELWLTSASSSDNCSDVILSNDFNGEMPNLCADEIIVEFTAIDQCGNVSSCISTIRTIDDTAPVIECPDDLIIECESGLEIGVIINDWINQVNAFDECSSEVDISNNSNGAFPLLCGEPMMVIFTATDNCNNSSTCVSTVSLIDTIGPIIVCPESLVIECNSNDNLTDLFTDWLTSVTAIDECDEDVILTNDFDGVLPAICGGTISILFIATDSCGNSNTCESTFEIIDTTAPDISCPENLILECDSDQDAMDLIIQWMDLVVASDLCDDSVAITNNYDYILPELCGSAVTILFIAWDDCGNTSFCAATVRIEDTISPEITCPENLVIECVQGQDISILITNWLAEVHASDLCDTSLVVINNYSGEIPDLCGDEIVVEYNAVDDCDNSSQCTASIILIDTTSPEITCPFPLVIECNILFDVESIIQAWLDGATAFDNCSVDMDVNNNYTISDLELCGDESVVIFSVSDDCGNMDSCQSTILWNDSQSPNIVCPEPLEIECNSNINMLDEIEIWLQSALAFDDCDTIVIITHNFDGEDPDLCGDIVEVVFIATDDCDNTSSCFSTIQVDDNAAPQIICPEDLIIECEIGIDINSIIEDWLALVTAQDDCTPDVLLENSYNGELPELCGPQKSILFSATDICGNTSTCISNISLIDNEAPTYTELVNLTVSCEDDVPDPNIGEIEAHDNCSEDLLIVWISDTSDGMSCPEIITRIYQISDECGNSVQLIQLIQISDDIPPMISPIDDLVIDCAENNKENLIQEWLNHITASDNCRESVIQNDFNIEDISGMTCGEILVVFTAIDPCDNTSQVEATIRIIDIEAPQFLLPPDDLTLACAELIEPIIELEWTDNCSEGGMATGSEISNGQSNPEIMTRTWTVSDDCDNISTWVQIITIYEIQEQTIIANICSGNSYIFNGNEYNEGGTYIDTLLTNDGCDSIVTLILTIDPPLTETVFGEYCEGGSYEYNGEVFTQPGSYIFDLINSEGCDSIVTLVLTENPALTDWIDAEICQGQSYDFNGLLLVSEGIYIDSIINNDGCLVIVTLHLVVIPPLEETIFAEFCEGGSYTYIGETLTEPGTYTFNLVNSEGCDSIVTLILTENPALTETLDVEICQGLSYEFNGEFYSESGVYIDTVKTAFDCDSIVILNLFVAPVLHEFIFEEICEGQSYDFNGITLIESGVYSDSLQNAQGCDSIITLTLIVNPAYTEMIEGEFCEGGSYSYNGNQYISPGVFTDTIMDPQGCLTVVTLNLIMTPALRDTITYEICDGQEITYQDSVMSIPGFYDFIFSTIDECDSIVTVRLIVNPILIDSIRAEICSGGVFIFNGQSLTEPGFYTDTLINQNGCYVLTTLRLRVLPVLEEEIFAEICQGDIYHFNGRFLSETGFYFHELQTQQGCDSLVILDLFVYPYLRDSIEATICQGATYSFNGRTLQFGGIYSDTLASSQDCDSIITLTLYVAPRLTTVLNEQICAGGEYYFDGIPRTEEGRYEASYITPEGCDSLVILNLTVANVLIGEDIVTVCVGESYIFNGKVFDETGVYVEVLQANGTCDSVVTLHFYVLPDVEVPQLRNICEGEKYNFYGQELTTPGIYEKKFPADNGCDSIIKLTLRVHPSFYDILSPTICKGDVFNHWNKTYDKTGIYKDTIGTSEGCLWITEIRLQVNLPDTTILNANICDGNTYIFDGQTLSQTGTYSKIVPSSKNCDSLILLNLLVQNQIESQQVLQICEGDSINWKNQFISQSGIYRDTLISSFGCDSIDILDLSVLEIKQEMIVIDICEGDFYDFNGEILETSGFYSDTLSTGIGCDSIIQLNLNVRDTFADVLQVDICEGQTYDWEGNVYDTAGQYTVHYQSGMGCDSILMLNLNIHQFFFDQFSETICHGDSVYWKDQYLSDSGVYSDTLVSSFGCDSLVELTLTVMPIFEQYFSYDICQGETVVLNGKTYYDQGRFIDTLSTLAGCDSLLIIDVFVKEAFNQEIVVEICEGEVYNFDGRTFEDEGIHLITYQAQNGCDSIYSIDLRVNLAHQEIYEISKCPGEIYEFNGNEYELAGTYIDSLVNESGCDSILILVLSDHPNLLPQIEGRTSFCEGDSSTLTVSGQGLTIEWSTGDSGQNITVTEEGWYIVTVTNSSGCIGYDSIEVFIAPEPDLFVGDEKFIGCDEDEVLLGISPSGPGTFEWSGPGINAGNRFLANPNVSEAGIYYLRYTSVEGCERLDSIIVHDYLGINDADINTNASCYGEHNGRIEVIEVFGGLPPYEYWLEGPINVSSPDGIFENLRAGSYKIRIIDAMGCDWDTIVSIRLLDPFDVDLGPDVYIRLGESVRLNPITSIGPNGIESFIWDPTTWLDCPTCFNPLSTPSQDITYIIRVTDINGCVATDDITIFVDGRAKIFVPNVFTPDRDGINDKLSVFADEGVKEILELHIFDRWGDHVFELYNFPPNDPYFGWDGRFRGKEMNPAVFVWYLKALLINEDVVLLKGEVTLFR